MSYIINKTNGEVLTTLIDGQVDTTTDLILIGKNYTGFGEQLNENFVKLLENFSGSSEPSRPVLGQLWYDTTDGRMKVYGATGWKAAGGPVVQAIEPLNFTTGDLWIDSNENQMWFFDGSDLILAGPIWKRSQRKTGFVAETLYDANNNAKPVLYLYVADSLLGIYSSTEFTPVPAIEGFTILYKGYTANSLVSTFFSNTTKSSYGIEEALTASQRQALPTTVITASQFMRSDQSTTNNAKILIQSNDGLTVGANQLGDLKVSGTTLILENVVTNGNISLKTKNSVQTLDAVYIDSSNTRVGIFTAAPQQTLDVNGDVVIRGNLVVQKDTVTLEVSQLRVEDINIELGYTGSTPVNDTGVDGAGVIIKGQTDKSILFKKTRQITDGTPAPYVNYSVFDVSENINLDTGKFFSIGGVKVLDGSTLSAAITSAPGITSVGPQLSLTVDDLYLNNNRIAGTVVNQDIEIEPLGTGNLAIIGDRRITGLGYPTDLQDAVPRYYAEGFAKILPISITLIQNGLEGALNSNIILMLNDIADPVIYVPGKPAYIHLQQLTYSTPDIVVTRSLKKFIIKNTGGANFWDFDSDLTSSV